MPARSSLVLACFLGPVKSINDKIYMITFYTYLHCKPDGTPFYVGKGHDRRATRIVGAKRNFHHQNIVRKYGKENIRVYVFPCDSEQQAFTDEIQQIAQLRNEGYMLCNFTDGGEGMSGHIFSEESLKKMSESRTGAKNHFFGRKHSIDALEKISASSKGRKKSPEVVKQIALSNTGKKRSEEARKRMSIAQKGIIKNIGHKHSLETKIKMSESAKKRNQRKVN